MQRIVSIHFPHFAMERHARANARMARFRPVEEEKPTVLVEHGTRGTRITATNAAARAAGAVTGQMLTDARAICPFLVVDQADCEADDDMIGRLALWCQRYTPVTAVDASAAPHPFARDFGLLLDTSGCDHLFGGEERMLADMERRFSDAGYTVGLAIAPTIGAAHALARHAQRPIIAQTIEDALALMANLPADALRLDGERVTLLRRLGLKTVESLLAIPRAALERRFRSRAQAQSVLLRRDQLTGAVREPLKPLRPAPPYRATLSCAEPAIDGEAVRFALGDLLARLSVRMEKASEGARAWQLTAFHADGGHSAVSITLARASRERAHIAHLFDQKIDGIDPGFGIDAFLLEAGRCERIGAQQSALIAQGAEEAANEALAAELSGLVDRLTNRFGARAVAQAAPVESHVPERAWRMVAYGNVVTWDEVEAASVFRTALRPFRLFDTPEEAQVIAEVPDGPPLTFRWRRLNRTITRARGPERIAPEWWREGTRGSRTRDYYEVEDTEGRRYWLYRDGLYSAPADAPSPRWFVHGVFGV